MSAIRLVNTTTSLRVDEVLEQEFFRVMNPAFRTAVERSGREPYIDVQFVCPQDMPQEDAARGDGIPDTDILGNYVSHNPYTHQAAIRVCPERVLVACDSWARKLGGSLPFSARYPTLLHAVIMHELAHLVMDARPTLEPHCRPMSWGGNLRWLDESSADSNRHPWSNATELDAEGEVAFRERTLARKLICQQKADGTDRWVAENVRALSPLQKQQKIVEESLANAFALSSALGTASLAALRVFIASQSPPYSSALQWSCNIDPLLATASAWKDFKQEVIGTGGRKWIDAPSNRQRVLEQLAKSLGSGETITQPCTFLAGGVHFGRPLAVAENTVL